MNSQTDTKKKTSNVVLQMALLLFVIGLPITIAGAYGLGGVFIAGAFIAAIIGLVLKDTGR